jgi:hypothetical protein
MVFGLLKRRPRKPKPITRRRTCLQVERLETRDCPAAPVIASFVATPLSVGHQVDLKGIVRDANPASVTITFTGIASGKTTADSSGHFDYVAQAAGVGTVKAVGKDQQKLTSNTATATFSVSAPSLTLTISYGSQRTVTLSGKVTAPSPGQLTVTFAGVVNNTVTTNSDGTFSLTTQASGLGAVQATTKDVWGQTSNTAQVSVASNKPVITNFAAIEGSGRIWTFQGQVTDENAKGLTVNLGGLPSLQNTTATVDSSGWFVLTVQLQPNENGTATAQTTDWWGLTSDQVTEWVYQTP